MQSTSTFATVWNNTGAYSALHVSSTAGLVIALTADQSTVVGLDINTGARTWAILLNTLASADGSVQYYWSSAVADAQGLFYFAFQVWMGCFRRSSWSR